MMRKRKSSRRREQIAFMELSSELTRSDRAAQCLRATGEQRHTSGDAHRTGERWQPSRFSSVFQLPCHLEYPDQADAAQHGDADGGDGPDLDQQRLQDPAAHHEAVEAVEQRHEVDLQAEGVHLQQHLQGEEHQQDLVGSLCGAQQRGRGGAAFRFLSRSKVNRGTGDTEELVPTHLASP